MSKENKDLKNQAPERTSREIQADVEKTIAETNKINAETRKAEADALKGLK